NHGTALGRFLCPLYQNGWSPHKPCRRSAWKRNRCLANKSRERNFPKELFYRPFTVPPLRFVLSAAAIFPAVSEWYSAYPCPYSFWENTFAVPLWESGSVPSDWLSPRS